MGYISCAPGSFLIAIPGTACMLRTRRQEHPESILIAWPTVGAKTTMYF